MGAQINSLSLSKSHAMEALLKEVSQKRGAHRRVESNSETSIQALARMARGDLPSYPGRTLTRKLRSRKSCAKMSQSSMITTIFRPARFWRSRPRQPRGSGVRHLVRRECIWTCRAFVPGTSPDLASGFDIDVNTHTSILAY